MIAYTIETKQQKAKRIANKITTIILSILLLTGAFTFGYKLHEQQTTFTDNELEMMSYYE